jgi:hypothetical protein
LCLLFAGNFLLVQVSVVKELLQVLLHVDLALRVDQVGLVDCLFQVQVHHVPGGEDMANVHVLDEGLHCLAALLHLLLGHRLRDLPGVPCQAGNEAVREAPIRVAIVKGLDNNSLLTSVTPLKDNYNLSCLCSDKLVINEDKMRIGEIIMVHRHCKESWLAPT